MKRLLALLLIAFCPWLAWAQVLAAGPSPTSFSGMANVPSLAALQATPSTFAAAIIRLDYAAGNGAPPIVYTSSPSACSLNAGAGDGAVQVRSSDGKCWIAQFPDGGADVREWGARTDGSSDAGAAINRCFAVESACVIPASTLGMVVTTPVVVPPRGSLVGASFSGLNNPYPAMTFPGQSFLLCNTPVCVTLGNGSSPASASIKDIIISRNGTPTPGAIGLYVDGGYNINISHVGIYNHDSCAKFANGISAHADQVFLALCRTHYYVFDGWPEVQIIGGRAGANGSGNYPASADFVYQTLTGVLGPGGGPNTIIFDDYQFNPGSGGVQCAFRWGGWTGSGGDRIETKLSNIHVEYHPISGGGIFCSDRTVPVISELFVHDMVAQLSNGTTPLFSLDPATALSKWYFDNNVFGCSGVSLTPAPASGPAFQDVHFSHNFGCVSAKFISNSVGNNTLYTVENNWNALTIGGSWYQLNMLNDIQNSLTDAATGHVAMSSAFGSTWTPVLSFGGGSAGLAYATRGGLIQRTAQGGFIATFTISLRSKGASTGAAQITGIPYACSSGAQGGTPDLLGNMRSLTGAAVLAAQNGPGTRIALYQSGSTGNVRITDANFTNTSYIEATITCKQAR